MRVIDRCLHHPNYLEDLTHAHGTHTPLPSPPEGCERCAQDFELFQQTQELLHIQLHTTRSPLSPDWQRNVWLSLGSQTLAQEHDPHTDEHDNIVPFTGTFTPPTHEPNSEEPQPSTPPPRRPLTTWLLAAAILSTGVLVGMLAASLPTLLDWNNTPQETATLTPPRVMLQAYSFRGDRVDLLTTHSRITSNDTLSFDYWNMPGSDGLKMRYVSIIALTRPHAYAFAAHSNDPPAPDEDLQWIADTRTIQLSKDDEPLLLEHCETQLKAPAGKTTLYGIFSHEPIPPKRAEWMVRAQLSNHELRPMQARISKIELEMLPETIFVDP